MGMMKTADGTQPQEAVNELIPVRGSREGDQYVMGHGPTFWAVLEKPDLAATERFVLVDLSDTVNFKHEETGKIRLYRLDIDIERGEAVASGEYIVYIGVVLEVDATNGSTKWILALHEEVDDQPTDGIAKRHYVFKWDEGLDLQITAGALAWGVSNVGDTDDVGWQTDVLLDSPAGDGVSAPGTGDLVMLVEETADVGSLSICVTAQYLTEGV